jgi:DNA gyrase subunit A
VFFFSDKGKVFVKKVYEIPQAPRNAKGRAIVNFVGMEPGEKVAAVTPVPRFEGDLYVVTLTRRGQIKKTALDEYENYRDKGIIGVRIEEGDQLLSAALTDGKRELVIATRSGMSIRFPEDQVRPTGRATMGVKGVELDEGDVVVGMGISGDGRDRVLAVCERGYGKQTPLEEFRLQSRGGKGVILIDASERNGPVVGVSLVSPTHEVLLVTDRGQMLRTKVSQIRETGRNAQGVRLMNVDEDERVVAIDAFESESLEKAEEGASTPPPSTPLSPGWSGGGPQSDAN